MIRPLRGQVVIAPEDPPQSHLLWTPDVQPRHQTTHRGRVLALGPPARTPLGVEVPHGFQVGDLVQYHFEFLEKLSKNEWGGQPAHWIPQSDVDGVWE